MPKAVSKAQAKFFGALAGGAKPSDGSKGISVSEAKDRTRGIDMSELPAKKGKKGALYKMGE